ncbi:hypothetical protein FRC10_002496 [Ceratobasidium sp. 414]|nr:hypothetical protein FRC10_002496 [Ceratobasidium sp. 414]
MSAAQVTAPQLSATEGTTYIPFKPRKRETATEQGTRADKPTPTPGARVTVNWRGLINEMIYNTVFEGLKPTVRQLVAFARQDRTTQDSEFGMNEVPTALVVGRDRALLSAILNKVVRVVTNLEEYTDEEDEDEEEVPATYRTRSAPLVVRLDEGDCNNTASALRALVGGFMSQFEETYFEIPIKRKTGNALAPFDMARLVAGYEDYLGSRKNPTNLVVVIEQLESFDTEIIQSLVYACSKHLNSLPITFIATVSDSNYLQCALTAATRAMLDTVVFQPPSGMALCLAVLQRTFVHRGDFIDEIILGETSIKVLKVIMEGTEGRIDALITALQLIYLEHRWYQAAVLDAANLFVAGKTAPKPGNDHKLNDQTIAEPEDVLLAFLTLSNRKGRLEGGFSPADVDVNLTESKLYEQAREFGISSLGARVARSRYALTVLFLLTWGFYKLGAYRQEIPLSFLDLLELAAKGPKEIEKYATWMLKKGFEYVNAQHPYLREWNLTNNNISRSAAPGDLTSLAQTVLNQVGDISFNPENPSHRIRTQLEAIAASTGQLEHQARVRFANRVTYAMSHYLSGYEHAYHELHITESTNGLKELVDPSPRSVLLAGLVRPGAYFHCECCDPEESHAPEGMAQMPDTCALFQRSLDAGRLLNIADWFGAFASIMQNEHVSRTTREPEPARKGSASRSRRATSSAHAESDADAEGEVDEALEVQREYQARFLQSVHELEFLGLIQATGRRKEHVLRSVFETGDQ